MAPLTTAPPPTAKQLARLDDDQLTRLWEALTAQPAEEAGERFHGSAVAAVCALLEAPSNRLASLDLSGVALCGIDGAGKPLPGCSYTSSAVERLCDALRSEHCELSDASAKHCEPSDALAKHCEHNNASAKHCEPDDASS